MRFLRICMLATAARDRNEVIAVLQRYGTIVRGLWVLRRYAPPPWP
jgi:hypothetical protein